MNTQRAECEKTHMVVDKYSYVDHINMNMMWETSPERVSFQPPATANEPTWLELVNRAKKLQEF